MVTTRPGGGVNPSIHGSNGSVSISVQDTTALDSRVFNTTTQLAEFPFNGDINSGNPLGIGWVQFSIGGGQRISASVSYLTSNLDILIDTQVTTTPRVVYPFSAASNPPSPHLAHSFLVMLQIAAGAINAPQLLRPSGIGDSVWLSRFNIRTIVNSPTWARTCNNEDVFMVS
ncbi:hypothetical protein EDB83DRAFT_1918692 [Lactarius deliciosus]|nr:hypothetical protein EDB83DRAFT_1918692 [Lactarius deliciosus]